MKARQKIDGFLLSEEENEAIFQELIWPILTNGVAAADFPNVVLIGGQPASGKTGIRSVLQKLSQYAGALTIDGDDLRSFHPKYDLIRAQEPLQLTALTAHDSGKWVEKSIAEAIRRGFSVLLETTMRRPGVVIGTLNGFAAGTALKFTLSPQNP